MAHEPLEQDHFSIQTEACQSRRRRGLTVSGPAESDGAASPHNNLIEFGIGRAAAEWKQAGSLSGRLGGLDSGS
jgi:hypothetical protein